jgi:hypothetical protein
MALRDSMRVTGPSPQFGIFPAKVKKSGGSDSDFEVPEEAGRTENKTAAKTASTSSLSALIAAQLHGEDEDIAERGKRRRKGVKNGQDILSVLDDMKLDMLAGKLSPDKMQQLVASLKASEDDVGDDRLKEIIEQIKLRARVELAKLRQNDKDG